MSRVLIVDDDAVIRRLLQVNFRIEGFEVETAACGQEAMDALGAMEGSPPDVVILDVTMPEVDGFQVCTWMREQPALRDVPVLVVSARSGEEDRAKGEQLGVRAYVTKPFDPSELVQAVRDALADETP